MKGKLTTALVALMALVVVSLAATGGVAADENTELLNETYEVDNETAEELRVTAMNTTGTLDVWFYGLDNDTETELQTATLEAGDNETDQEGIEVDGNYSEYRIVVEGDDVGELDVVTLEEVSQTGAGMLPDFDTDVVTDGPLALIGGGLVVVLVGLGIAFTSSGRVFNRGD